MFLPREGCSTNMTNPWFKNCTNRCQDGTQPCNCDFMPGRKVFNSREERIALWKKGAIIEPWVVETWRQHSEAIGGPAIAELFRKNLIDPDGARQAAGIKRELPRAKAPWLPASFVIEIPLPNW